MRWPDNVHFLSFFLAVVCLVSSTLSQTCQTDSCPTSCVDTLEIFLPNATSYTLAEAISCINTGGTLILWPNLYGNVNGYPNTSIPGTPDFTVPGIVSGCAGQEQTFLSSGGVAYVNRSMTIISKCSDLPTAFYLQPGTNSCPVFTILVGAVTVSNIAVVGGPCPLGTYPYTVLASAASSNPPPWSAGAGVFFTDLLVQIPNPGALIVADTCPFPPNTLPYASIDAFAVSSLSVQQLNYFPSFSCNFSDPLQNNCTEDPTVNFQDWANVTGVIIPFDTFAVVPNDNLALVADPYQSYFLCSCPRPIPSNPEDAAMNWFIFLLFMTLILLAEASCGCCVSCCSVIVIGFAQREAKRPGWFLKEEHRRADRIRRTRRDDAEKKRRRKGGAADGGGGAGRGGGGTAAAAAAATTTAPSNGRKKKSRAY